MAEDVRQHLRTLGLEANATPEQIKQAYRDMARVWHPDKFAHDTAQQAKANARMQEINAAYQALKHYLPDTRHNPNAASASSPYANGADRWAAHRPGASPPPDLPRDVFPWKSARTLLGAIEAISSVALSPDGRLAFGVGGYRITCWDVAAGQIAREIKVDKGTAQGLAVSADGRYFVFGNNLASWAGGAKYELRVCEAATGREIQRIRQSGHLLCLAFSPNGEQIAVGDTLGVVRYWDAASGREVQTFPGVMEAGGVQSIAYVGTGKYIVTLKTGKVFSEIALWEVRRARLMKQFTVHERQVMAYGQIGGIAVSPDGNSLLVINNDRAQRNWSLHLWDMESGEEIRAFRGHADTITQAVFSPDGRFVLSGSEDKTVRLWNVQNGKEFARGVGLDRAVRAIAVSADSSTALSGGDDRAGRVWLLKQS